MFCGCIFCPTGLLELPASIQDGLPNSQHLLSPIIFVIQTLLMTQILVSCISRRRIIIILFSPVWQLLLPNIRLFLPNRYLHPSVLLLIVLCWRRLFFYVILSMIIFRFLWLLLTRIKVVGSVKLQFTSHCHVIPCAICSTKLVSVSGGGQVCSLSGSGCKMLCDIR